MDTDKVQIFIDLHKKESQTCLRAEIYGCEVE